MSLESRDKGRSGDTSVALRKMLKALFREIPDSPWDDYPEGVLFMHFGEHSA